jgi:outer membrane lipoprotein-sorting protein
MYCSARFALLLSILFLNIPVWAQQTQTATTPPPAPQDPQAVSVLNQSFAVAGGEAAYSAIADYTATGNITYFGELNAQGTATISGRSPSELHIDASLPSGTRSFVINGAQTTTSDATRILSKRSIQAPMMTGNYLLPYRELAAIFNNPQFSLAYHGIVQIDGHSLHNIQAQRLLPGQKDPSGLIQTYHTIDFYIDSSTLLLYMTADVLPRRATPRTIRYSNYQAMNGVLVPFSIVETVEDAQTSLISLSQITFNVGLQDSTFDLGTLAQ